MKLKPFKRVPAWIAFGVPVFEIRERAGMHPEETGAAAVDYMRARRLSRIEPAEALRDE